MSFVGCLLLKPAFWLVFISVDIQSVSGCGTRQRSLLVEDREIIELLEEIKSNTADIDSKVVKAIEETEDLLKQILAFVGKR